MDGGALHRVRHSVPHARLHRLWSRHYWLAAGALVALGIGAMGRPFLRRHGAGPPLPHNDSVILEYVGWFLARGNTLYVDIWEIKPPVAFLPSHLLAHLTGTDMYAHHVGGIALTALCLATTAAVAARVVGRVTGTPLAGVAVALAFFALPDLLYLPWLGYKAKALVVALGAVAVDRAYAERYLSSGAIAGLAVGVWQLGVVFPLLTTAIVWTAGGREGLRRHVIGGGAAAVAVVGYLLLVGDVGGFVAEVILGPLVLRTDRAGFDPETYFDFFPSAVSAAVAFVGLGGLLLALRDRHELPSRPLSFGGILVGGVLLIDFDGLWDMLLPLLFVAIGAGLLVGRLSRERQVLALAALAVVLVPTFAPSEFVRQDRVEMEESDGFPPALDPEREYVYWNHRPVQSCHFFGGGTQRSILEYYPGAETLTEIPCGDLELYLDVTRHRLLGVPLDSGDGPTSASTDTTPEPEIVVGGFDYRVANSSTIVIVPLANRADERRTGRLFLEVTTGDDTVERCVEASLAGGERRTLRVQFGEVSSETLSIDVWDTDDAKTSANCG
jgi:hypothetical protein